MHYFNTLILEEANRFLLTLDTQTMEKVLYNIRLAAQTNVPGFSKKCINMFGNFVPNTVERKSGFWHFGIKRGLKIRWW